MLAGLGLVYMPVGSHGSQRGRQLRRTNWFHGLVQQNRKLIASWLTLVLNENVS